MKEKVPAFRLLKKNYPKNADVSHEALFKELGWESLNDDPIFANTCAIRMSLCLIRCGMTLNAGGMRVQKGEHRGARVETSREKLANYLVRTWGEPTFKEPSAAKIQTLIGIDGGVLSFSGWVEYNGGHIDIYDGLSPMYDTLWHFGTGSPIHDACGSECYWQASEFWFWRA